MDSTRSYVRPVFEDCLAAWKTLLAGRGHATELVWILEENLCFERDQNRPARFRLGFQTQFAPHPPDAAKATYHHFSEMDQRLVFYRLGSNGGRSICIELCDNWFEPKGESEGYVRRDDWLVSFFPGGKEELEEITEAKRWQGRVVRGRPLSAVDFCMTLAALRELKAHGRVLTPDERFGLRILRSMHRIKAPRGTSLGESQGVA
jgi:hypothetical protein